MKKHYESFCRFEERAAIVCLVLCVLIILVASIARVAKNPIAGSLDLALLLFTWSVFLGADVAYRKGNLINVNLWESFVGARTKQIVEIAIYVIVGAFLVTLVYFGVIQSIKTWARAFQGMPAISYTWVTISVPISSLFMLVTTGIKIKRICADLSR
jgi:TRAP-type C4-dicarboxylate transport system permease small subunit